MSGSILRAWFLRLLFRSQLLNDRLLAVAIRFPVEPVINSGQQHSSLGKIGILFRYGLEQRQCLGGFSTRGMERGKMKARIRIARTQSRGAREMIKSFVERFVPLEQYPEIKVGLKIIGIISQLALEGACRALAVSKAHQSPPVPGLQARQLGIQFERALEFLHSRMLVVRQQQDRTDEQPRL